METLGSAADNSMILDSGEPDDITNEVERRKAFIAHVQVMAREKKSRLYGLMVYSFKQRLDELDRLLSNIEEGLQDETTAASDLQRTLDRLKNNEVKLHHVC